MSLSSPSSRPPIDHNDGHRNVGNPRTINSLLSEMKFSQRYSRKESFQHNLLGPLRRGSRVFIGVKNDGIFLVTTPEDVDATLGFYTWRIRAELRHVRDLRAIARRTQLMRGFESKLNIKRERAVIYLDESGTPDVTNRNPPVFVIAAIVVDSRKELAGIDQRFRNAFASIHRPQDHELKSSGLSVAKHARVLHELSLRRMSAIRRWQRSLEASRWRFRRYAPQGVGAQHRRSTSRPSMWRSRDPAPADDANQSPSFAVSGARRDARPSRRQLMQP